MKKVGILTITDGANYGNRLQNYAMQVFLTSLDLDVETIQRETPRDKHGIVLLKYLVKENIKRLIGRKNTYFALRERKRKFLEFNRKYIKFSNVCLSNNQAPEGLKNQYDYFICGSDQIWNANFDVVKCDIKNHLAAFAYPHQRIAFAASFGTNSIAPGFEEVFQNELSEFKAIAVREDAGKKIVDSVTGKNATVVLDPTLLLNKNEWIAIEKKAEYIHGEKYIVTYFLGGRNQRIQSFLQKIAKKENARIINLEIEFIQDGLIEDRDVFLTTPDEFIWLIHHAEYVLTDSFHASVFSIIFQKSFLVYQRIAAEKDNDMSSRIDTLLSKFNLLECRDNIDNPTKLPFKPDYSAVDSQLETERKKAINFLKYALEV